MSDDEPTSEEKELRRSNVTIQSRIAELLSMASASDMPVRDELVSAASSLSHAEWRIDRAITLIRKEQESRRISAALAEQDLERARGSHA